MHRRRIKIEEKELDFVFELVSVQFNQTGQYQLILTAENPLLENSGSGVRLRVNDGEVLQANSSSTDTIEQANVDNMYTCSPNKFAFTLPKGTTRSSPVPSQCNQYCESAKIPLHLKKNVMTGDSVSVVLIVLT